MMLSIVVINAAIVILSIREVENSPRRKIYIDDVINLLQQQPHNNLRQKPDDITSDGSTLEEFRVADDEDNSRYGSMTSGDMIELIQQTIRDTNNYKKLNKSSKNELYDKSYLPLHLSNLGKNIYQRKKKSYSHKYANEANPDQLFSYYGIQSPPEKKDRYRERRYPYDKISKGYNANKMRSGVVDNIDDYSKIYIILNPLAIQKSKRDSLSNLIMKVLSISNRNEGGDGQKKEYYKAFPVMSDLLARRSRKDSRESFGLNDSMEDTYKQKRSRNDHGGGGNNGGGRTAIPYIRQRGDIYERDN